MQINFHSYTEWIWIISGPHTQWDTCSLICDIIRVWIPILAREITPNAGYGSKSMFYSPCSLCFLYVHIYKDDQIFKLHMWHTFKIWQNIFKDNCHLFYSFIWMITTLGIDKFLKKKLCHSFQLCNEQVRCSLGVEQR
jgi:hypothetical protein